MAENPKYVRLANRLSQGMVADVHGSSWSIAGLDVRQFPEDRAAARFVKAKLADGVLEPASKSEWEEVHAASDELEAEHQRQNPDGSSGLQEAALRRAAAKGTKRLQEARDAEQDDEDDEEAEQDRADRVAQGDEQETDDPEEQVERSNPTRSTKASKAKSGKKKKAKASADAAE